MFYIHKKNLNYHYFINLVFDFRITLIKLYLLAINLI